MYVRTLKEAYFITLRIRRADAPITIEAKGFVHIRDALSNYLLENKVSKQDYLEGLVRDANGVFYRYVTYDGAFLALPKK